MSKPWIKSWVCSLNKPKIMSLPPDEFKCWQILQWIAGEYDRDGLLPPVDECAFIMHNAATRVEDFMVALLRRGLLERDGDQWRLHDWLQWQSRKPSDEPERVRERVARHREKKKETDVTPRNALLNVTESVTPRNARNAVQSESESESESEKEIHLPSESVSLASQSDASPARARKVSAKQESHMTIFDALMTACGWVAGSGFTKAEQGRVHAAAKDILAAGGTPEEVARRAHNYIERWGEDILTPTALASHWAECARVAPPAKRVRTTNEQKTLNTIAASADFDRLVQQEREQNGRSGLQGGNGPTGPRLQSGHERRAKVHLLPKTEGK